MSVARPPAVSAEAPAWLGHLALGPALPALGSFLAAVRTHECSRGEARRWPSVVPPLQSRPFTAFYLLKSLLTAITSPTAPSEHQDLESVLTAVHDSCPLYGRLVRLGPAAPGIVCSSRNESGLLYL